MFSGCCQIARGVSFGASISVNGALTTLIESPRSRLKPIVSRTRALTFSSSAGVSGVKVTLPDSSTVRRWFTTIAAVSRRMVPVALRVTLTVLSTS